ncbi:unnamed protein product [Penicillium crustosum]
MGNTFSQFYFIPAPTVTENNCPDQAGRVHLVTGGYGGVGFELCKILYQHNATLYLAGRSNSKAQTAIQSLRRLYPKSRGRAEFLELDLSDLPTLKRAVAQFLSKEDKLHVLTLNAGVRNAHPLRPKPLLSGACISLLISMVINHQVMNTPKGTQTAQGHEMQIGTNCLGSHLLYLLLRPILLATAQNVPPGSVRVTWAGSIAIDVGSHKPGGMKFSPTDSTTPDTSIHPQNLYAASKAGNLFLAAVNGRRDARASVLHLCWNPGNLRTDLIRHNSKLQNLMLEMVMNPPVMGAYTELFAAVGEISMAETGSYIAPWGRKLSVRPDVEAGCRPEIEGGLGSADKFVAWCDRLVAEYV